MPPSNRNFLTIFAIFFVVITPFLVFFSFGYDLNLRSKQLQYSLQAKIETIPNGANIKINDKSVKNSPSEYSLNPVNQTKIELSGENYLTETITATGKTDQNTFLDLTKFYLLPTKPEVRSSDDAIKNKNVQILQLLTPEIALVQKDSNYWLQNYGLGGLLNNPLILTQNQIPSAKAGEKIEYSAELVKELINPESKMQILNANQFLVGRLLVENKVDYSKVDFLPQSIRDFEYLESVSDAKMLFLDKEKGLWSYDTVTKTKKFIDKGFEYLYKNPSGIWLKKADTVFRLQPNDLSVNFDLRSFVFFTHPSLLQSNNQFKILNVFQGVAIFTGTQIFYLPDFKPNNWELLTDNASFVNTEKSNIFWTNSNNELFFQNLYTGLRTKVTDLKQTPKNMIFVPDWNRLLVYGDGTVDSIWINEKSQNETLANFQLNNWIAGRECLPKVDNKIQYCLKSGELEIYKNNMLW